MGSDFRVPMGALKRAFAVDATVTRPAPDDTPIVLTDDRGGIWVPVNSLALPEGSPWRREEEIKCLAFDVDDVPTCPKGTLIEAPERRGDDPKIWIVDGLADQDGHAIDRDQVKAIVRFYADAVT